MRKFICLILISVFFISPVVADQPEKQAQELRVLFVGNSYTYWVEGVLNFVLSHSGYGDSKFEFHTKGATPLSHFADDKELHKKIQQGNFDYVVLQEWSAGVGNDAENTKYFQESLSELSTIIRAAEADPVLYMTWGRDDVEGYNGFVDMSKRVAKGYRQASKTHNIKVVPVGEIWGIVRNQNEALGLSLYEDGTHPSTKGQVLIAAAFMRALFSDPLEWGEAFSSHMSEEEWLLIKNAVEQKIGMNYLK